MTSKCEINLAGETVWLCAMTGQVAGDKKWSETRVQGRNVLNQPGHTVIGTQVNTRHEFWLIAPDGEERLIEFFNSQVAARDGQIMTAIWGAKVKNNKETGPFLMLRNDNAQITTWLIPNAKSLLHQMRLADPMIRDAVMGFAAAALLCLVFQSWLLLIVPIIGVIAGQMQRSAKAKNIKQIVTEAMTLELQSFAQTQRQPLTQVKQAMVAP